MTWIILQFLFLAIPVVLPMTLYKSNRRFMDRFYDLRTPRGVLAFGGNVYIVSEEQQCLYQLDNGTLEVLRKMDLTLMTDWIRPVAMGIWGGNGIQILSDDGRCVLSQLYFDGLTTENLGVGSKYDKMIPYAYEDWVGDKGYVVFVVDVENSKIKYPENYDQMLSSGESSVELDGLRVINCGMSSIGLRVVSVANDDPKKVKVIAYDPFDSFWGGAFSNPQTYEYSLDSENDLTLTPETEMLFNNLYNVCYYYKDNKVYRWRYQQPNSQLPTEKNGGENVFEISPSGKITCMTQSPDGKYLYIGVYDEGSASGLKGSVYICNTDTWEIVNTFTGIADKPLQIIYKQQSN